MEQDKKHTVNQKVAEESDKLFFSKAEIPFEKSKDEVWASLSVNLQSRPEKRKRWMNTERIVLGLAAGFMLLLSLGAVMRFYTKTVRVEAGEQLTYVLPDGSKTQMNAQSIMSYNPFWWQFSREIGFEGEAFFKVEKGSTFRVTSEKGIVEVLGTSFNVYSRPDSFRVLCVTGKVRVKNKVDSEEILTPGYEATISNISELTVRKTIKTDQYLSWKDGMFHFTATPLQLVFSEIERQYNIRIIFSGTENLSYTGFFSKENSVEDVLKVVCRPFNLNHLKKQEGIYEITD